VRSKADETLHLAVLLYRCRDFMYVWMHITNRCKMHDSDFHVLITTRFRETTSSSLPCMSRQTD